MKRLLYIVVAIPIVGLSQALASTLTPRFSHIRTAAIQYYGDDSAASFIGRHYDISIGGWNPVLAKSKNPNMKVLSYGTLSSLRRESASSDDTILMRSFCTMRINQGGSPTKYNYDSMFLYATQNQTVSFTFGGVTTTFALVPGEKLKSSTWGSTRQQADFTQPSVWEYMWYKMCFYTDSGSKKWDGIMQDEAYATRDPKWGNNSGANYPHGGGEWSAGDSRMNNRWDKINPKTGIRYTDVEVRDSLRFLQNHVWMPMLGDSLNKYNRFMFPNAAAYGVMCTPACGYWASLANAFPAFPGVGAYPTVADVKYSNVGILYGEGMAMSPTYTGYMADAWQMMDSLSGPWSGGMAIFWYYYNLADQTNYGLARTQMFNLAHYYMGANPNNCYFMGPTNNTVQNLCVPAQNGNNDYYSCDTLKRWWGAIEVNIGTPATSRTQPAAGIYTRQFSNGFVVWNNNGSGSANVNLGATYRPVNVDGSLGAEVSSTTIPYKTGQLFVGAAGYLGSLSVSNATATEGGQLAFIVTRTWTAGAVTITFRTNDGSAIAPGDYTAQLTGQLIIPDGSLTGTIYVSTNTDALLEPSETMSITLLSATSGTIVTATAAGSIIDGTAQPSPTTEKKLKLKKE